MIRVESKVLTPEQLEQARKKVKKMEEQSYSKMAIMYFLSKKYNTVSGTCENEKDENFVITLS